MTLTLYALFTIPFMLGVVIAPESFRRIIQKLATMNNDHVLTGFLYVLFAFMIFSSSGIKFEWEWSSLLGWLGIIMWIKGLTWIFWPAYYVKKMKYFSDSILPAFGFLGLLIATGLIYVDIKFL